MANINLAAVDWVFVGLMTALAFLTALLGSYIAFRSRFWGAILAAVLFAIGFVGWNYYPHQFGLPVLKATGDDRAAAASTAALAAPAFAAQTPPASVAAAAAALSSPPGAPANSTH